MDEVNPRKRPAAGVASADALAAFNRNGWVKVENLIPPDLLDHAQAGARAFYEGKHDRTLAGLERIADDPYSPAARILNNEMVCVREDALGDLARQSLVAAYAGSLAGARRISLFGDSLILKRPGKAPDQDVIGWHSDLAYWPTCTSQKMLTAWIPFQDSDATMGTITYVDGSHQWDAAAVQPFVAFGGQDLDPLIKYLEEHHPGHKLSTMDVRRGDVVFHHARTLHASAANLGGRDRLALALHLQDETNHHQDVARPDGSPLTISYDLVCRKDASGRPDYADPLVFPVLWSR